MSMFSLFDDDINSFIKEHFTAILATVDDAGQPYSSTIFYVLGKNNGLYFVTKSQTAKYKNLQEHNKAAITVLQPDKPIAVNLTGTVAEITEDDGAEDIRQEIFKMSYKKLGDYAPIIKLNKGSFGVFCFTPNYAKLTDYTKPIGQTTNQEKQF